MRVGDSNKFSCKYQCALLTGSKFTLIEMLVVIAIIGILASFLMPSLQKAHNMAVSVSCQNGLKQSNIALTTYSNEYNLYLPPCMDPSSTGTPYWNSVLVSSGYLDKYILDCPALKSASLIANSSWVWFTSFGINYSLSPVPGSSLRISKVKNISEKMVLMDVEQNPYGSGKGMCRVVFPYYSSSSFGHPHARHNESVNILWLDGHGSSIGVPDPGDPYLFPPFNTSSTKYQTP